MLPYRFCRSITLGHFIVLLASPLVSLGGVGEEPADAPAKPARSIKVAGILMEHARTGDFRQRNFEQAETLIRQAAAAGAELVCTCEQFLDGYGFDANKMSGVDDPRASRCEDIDTSPYIQRLSELARELKVVVVAGVALKQGTATYNSALVFDARGRLAGVYRKTHNANQPARWFAPLTDAQKKSACASYDVGPGRLSVKICNDRHFTETTRHMVGNGCELLLCPAYGKYSPSRLLDDSREFGLWAVFVHPDGCQFIDHGRLILERKRRPGERCFVLHEVEFRKPQ
jgi:predicted amidohydrolase